MPTNPDLRLSREFGNGDFQRRQQVYGVEMFDWRDWVDNYEYEDFPEWYSLPLAVERFNAVLAAADKEAALIHFKLTYLNARVPHARPRDSVAPLTLAALRLYTYVEYQLSEDLN